MEQSLQFVVGRNKYLYNIQANTTASYVMQKYMLFMYVCIHVMYQSTLTYMY